MFAKLVAEGKLAPVEERLPDNPRVLDPPEIGRYGGTEHVYATSAFWWAWDGEIVGYEWLLAIEPDLTWGQPNIIESFDFNASTSLLTLHLRKGMKWSDGVEFTSADFMYHWFNVANNPLIYPVLPDMYKANGVRIDMNAPDAYTVTIDFFGQSNAFILNLMATTTTAQDWQWWYGMYQPAHFAKQYHPSFIGQAEAERRAAEAGYANWVEWYWRYTGCFFAMQEWADQAPTLAPYVCVERTPAQMVFERNAYYWKVDTAGNQLPYIDRIIVHFAESQDVVDGKIISGEVDMAYLMTQLISMPVYKDNEELGGYEARLWSTPAMGCIELNLTHPDPGIRAIFQDVRFRQALSLAIDRDELNESTALGLGTPSSVMVPRESPYYVEGGDTSYIEFDPATANGLLDAMGLDQRGADGFRLRPDGTPLQLTYETSEITAGDELLREYWRDIGINIELKAQTQELLNERVDANLIDIMPGGVEFNVEPSFSTLPQFYVPLTYTWPGLWGNQWALWREDNNQGMEPPDEIKRLYDLYEDLKLSPTIEGRIAPAQEIMASMRDNLWLIGTLRGPAVVIVKDDLKNVPETGVMTWDLSRMYPYYPMTWFFEAREPILDAWPGRF
ncbi:ABC transporter substrate-binding protein [Candidatus Bipolaricaulota bacterium]|nr:ABC transporter substrate-binding protein [Candidatus Bipolaricaulota bacterium]